MYVTGREIIPTQGRLQDAMAFVHSGRLGSIRTVKVCCYQGWMRPKPKLANSEPPNGVDYDAWLGPAPKKPFNSSNSIWRLET